MTVNQVAKKNTTKENGVCPIMIKVFLGLSGLNLENAKLAKSKQILGRRSSALEKNLPKYLATQKALWGTHNLEGFGRHLYVPQIF